MEGGVLTRSLVNADAGATGAHRGGEKTEQGPLVRSTVRRNKLSDITNTVRSEGNEIGRTSHANDDKENPKAMASQRPKDCITQLMKENAALLKLLEQKNEIIQLSSIKLQQLNEQNCHLARANSQMLAELNLGKERLKVLQHELSCTRAALKSKTLELEEKEKLKKEPCLKIDSKEGGNNHDEVAAGACDTTTDKKTSNHNKKCKSKSESLGSIIQTDQVPSENFVDGRRRSLRRRSINLTPESYQPKEGLLKTQAIKIPLRSNHEPLHEDTFVQLDSSNCSSSNGCMIQVKSERQDLSSSSRLGNEELQRRSTVVRPLRKAAEKVSSYKEMSLKSKMRRVE